jgi:hypothetical protein
VSPDGGELAGGVEDDVPSAADMLRLLRRCVAEVGVAEFAAEDLRFDSDSRLGRQMLYLLAYDSWIRGSLEAVDLFSATSVATTIRLDLDLATILHEAFEGDDRLALPLLVFPATTSLGGQALAPDLTVLGDDGVSRRCSIASRSPRVARAARQPATPWTPQWFASRGRSRCHRKRRPDVPLPGPRSVGSHGHPRSAIYTHVP